MSYNTCFYKCNNITRLNQFCILFIKTEIFQKTTITVCKIIFQVSEIHYLYLFPPLQN